MPSIGFLADRFKIQTVLAVVPVAWPTSRHLAKPHPRLSLNAIDAWQFRCSVPPLLEECRIVSFFWGGILVKGGAGASVGSVDHDSELGNGTSLVG